MKVIETGLIGKDGSIRLPMDKVRQSLSSYAGERVVVTFEIIGHGSTQAQQGYYYGYILPTITQAMHELGEQRGSKWIDGFLCEQFGSSQCEGRKMDKEEMSRFIEWLQQYAAENLNVYIEDARCI